MQEGLVFEGFWRGAPWVSGSAGAAGGAAAGQGAVWAGNPRRGHKGRVWYLRRRGARRGRGGRSAHASWWCTRGAKVRPAGLGKRRGPHAWAAEGWGAAARGCCGGRGPQRGGVRARARPGGVTVERGPGRVGSGARCAVAHALYVGGAGCCWPTSHAAYTRGEGSVAGRVKREGAGAGAGEASRPAAGATAGAGKAGVRRPGRRGGAECA